jgi:hypothetical protein
MLTDIESECDALRAELAAAKSHIENGDTRFATSTSNSPLLRPRMCGC